MRQIKQCRRQMLVIDLIISISRKFNPYLSICVMKPAFFAIYISTVSRFTVCTGQVQRDTFNKFVKMEWQATHF